MPVVNPGIRRLLASAIQRLFNGASFSAPLTHSAIPTRAASGTTGTFTRATTATVKDHEGVLRTAIAGEARFEGARRVYNECPTPSASIAVAANKTITATVGVYIFSMGAGTGTITFTGTATGSTGTLNASASGRTSKVLTITVAGTIIATASVATCVDIQFENITGRADQTTPSEYVSVGVEAAPYYHGSFVDGVKCFATDINGAAIPSSTLLGYLAEGARTNLCLQSQDFATTWSINAFSVTISSNAAVAPDGTTTADKIVETATNTDHGIFQSITFTAAAYTVSVYAKKGERDWLRFNHNATGAYKNAYFNLATGVVGTVDSGWTAAISDAGNGWYRCSITFTATAAAISVAIYNTTSDGGTSHLGDITKGTYLWGAQVELGSFASSYIATTTVAVTRNADVEAVSTSGNIAAAAGSVYLEYTPTHTPSGTIALWGTYVDASNYTAILHDATNLIFRKRIAGVNYDATIANAFVSGTTYKACATWGTSGTSITLNGTEGTPHANTTAAQIGSTMQWGADGNSLQQPFANIRNCRDWLRQLSASERTAVTA